ncbi:MAG TPA: hypothetical protein VM243_02945 [Phycisphaerae bacterium]|nr:hypothetical protein [Phycisphaerae bacterium]
MGWVIRRDDLATSPGEETFRLGKSGNGYSQLRRWVSQAEGDGAVRIKVGVYVPGQEAATKEVEQVWDPERMWWRSFRRTLDGHLDLEAFLVEDEQAPSETRTGEKPDGDQPGRNAPRAKQAD